MDVLHFIKHFSAGSGPALNDPQLRNRLMQQKEFNARLPTRSKSGALSRRGVLCCSVALLFIACLSKSDSASDAATVDTSAMAPLPAPDARKQPAVVGVTEYGYGPLRAGMTYDAANAALNGALKPAAGANLAECDYVKWEGGPQGLLVMVDEGKIGRVDVIDSTVASAAGARVGDTEEKIQSLYPGRVTVSPHKYTDGHYLTVRAANAADSMNILVFETEHGKVTRFRGGIRPWVEYVEGCS